MSHRSITRFAAAVMAMAVSAAALTVSCATPPAPVPSGADQTAVAQRQAAQTAQAAQAAQTAQDIIANYISAQLNADPMYYYRHVDVRVDEDGVAILSGYVWDTAAIYHARRIASSVQGVTRVATNQLELERNGRDNGVTR